MKTLLRRFIPSFLLAKYRRMQRRKQQKLNSRKSTQEVFSEIYSNNKWGGIEGDYNSGDGTTDVKIAEAYQDCLKKIDGRLVFSELNAVDLGCGDMRIGSAIFDLFKTYTGVDIVEELINSHRKNFPHESVQFKHINIIEDELPDGEVCLIRQVFQHLSNEQIGKIIPKLSKYKYVLITEHLPTPNPGLEFNLDKAHGGDIRLFDNSGVYLTEAPFNISASDVEVILEVEGHGFEQYVEPWMKGVIQTILYKPQS